MLSHILKPPLFNVLAKYAGEASPRVLPPAASVSALPFNSGSVGAEECSICTCSLSEAASRGACRASALCKEKEVDDSASLRCSVLPHDEALPFLELRVLYEAESLKAEALARHFKVQLLLEPALRVEVKVAPLQADSLEDLLDRNAAFLEEARLRRKTDNKPLLAFLFLSETGGVLHRAGEAFRAEATETTFDRRVFNRPLAGSAVSLICIHEAEKTSIKTESLMAPTEKPSRNSSSRDSTKVARGLCMVLRSLGARSLAALSCETSETSFVSTFSTDSDARVTAKEFQLQCLTLSSEAADSTTMRKFEQWTAQQKGILCELVSKSHETWRRTAQRVVAALSTPQKRHKEAENGASDAYFSDSYDDEEEEEKRLLVAVKGCGRGGGDDAEADVEDALAEVASSRPGSLQAKEQLTPSLRRSLEKEGYKLVGSHSAVKICRWTRSALRGRGGCYKHTFYGILSYGCMEFTSSVACANRCLFCWRHHTNLAAKEWDWKQDDPKAILEEAVAKHLRMIRELRGLPGLREDFFESAKASALHCALSLVGEPIMYPRVNELLGLMHEKHISTFLVTNAQHPDPLASLRPVTQLYLSIDAATEADLRRLDRPLMRDSWQKFLRCIDILRLKKQRTVFRLTLVHGYNCLLGPAEEGTEEETKGVDAQLARGPEERQARHLRRHRVTSTVEGYAALVLRGKPDFIEIKGMTFCGGLDRNSLSMENVPRHQQVLNFATQLCAALPAEEYALASEHEHSCSVLIAHTKYHIGGQWHTWIDYPKFFELALSGSTDFTGVEYSTPSPSWGVLGAEGRGFDPNQKRIFGKGRRRKEAATLE